MSNGGYARLTIEDCEDDSDTTADSLAWSPSSSNEGTLPFSRQRQSPWQAVASAAKAAIGGTSDRSRFSLAHWTTTALLLLAFVVQTTRLDSAQNRLSSLSARVSPLSTPQPPPPPPLSSSPVDDVAPSLGTEPSLPDSNATLPSNAFADITQGSWVPPSHPWTMADVKLKHGMTALGNAGKLGQHRLVQVNAFEWMPDTPSRKLHQWNTFEFLKRTFNSEAGLLLVGDSVSMQSYETLSGLLHLVPPEFANLSEAARNSWFTTSQAKDSHKNVRYEIRLKNDSSVLALLEQALPEVPRERFSKPFATAIRHDTLLDTDVIAKLAQQTGLEPEFKDWLSHDRWQDALPKAMTDTWRGQQNSILLLNTGAHWSRICFGVPERDNVLKLSSLVAQALVSDLATRPMLDIIYRSTSPGHPNCEKAFTPVYPAPVDVFQDHPLHNTTKDNDWNWKQFEDVNEIWKRHFDQVWLEKKGSTALTNRFAYLDVTEMSGQRPDAHKGNGDCLHWTLPGVPNYWIRMVWHVMQEWGLADKDNSID
ncbi:hypothetical protein ACM66B_004051 [Microbotryomycetes sp. NB124-2]